MIILLLSFVVLFVCLFRAATAGYGHSQARGLIGAVAAGPTPEPQQRQTQAMSVTYTTAHGNTGSLTQWVKPGFEPATSWFPVGFVSTAPLQEFLFYVFNRFLLGTLL